MASKKINNNVPSRAAATDGEQVVYEAAEAEQVTGVSYTPEAAATGANTETRTLELVNRGQSGAGTTVVATLALVSGVNLVKDDEKPMTLHATTANRQLAEGDILVLKSTHAGSTGLADPGGYVQIDTVPLGVAPATTGVVAEASGGASAGYWGKRPGTHADNEYALTTGPDAPTGANGPE